VYKNILWISLLVGTNYIIDIYIDMSVLITAQEKKQFEVFTEITKEIKEILYIRILLIIYEVNNINRNIQRGTLLQELEQFHKFIKREDLYWVTREVLTWLRSIFIKEQIEKQRQRLIDSFSTDLVIFLYRYIDSEEIKYLFQDTQAQTYNYITSVIHGDIIKAIENMVINPNVTMNYVQSVFKGYHPTGVFNNPILTDTGLLHSSDYLGGKKNGKKKKTNKKNKKRGTRSKKTKPHK
jgi:hypothetical protein